MNIHLKTPMTIAVHFFEDTLHSKGWRQFWRVWFWNEVTVNGIHRGSPCDTTTDTSSSEPWDRHSDAEDPFASKLKFSVGDEDTDEMSPSEEPGFSCSPSQAQTHREPRFQGWGDRAGSKLHLGMGWFYICADVSVTLGLYLVVKESCRGSYLVGYSQIEPCEHPLLLITREGLLCLCWGRLKTESLFKHRLPTFHQNVWTHHWCTPSLCYRLTMNSREALTLPDFKKKIWEGAVKFLAPKKEMLCLIAGLRLGWQILTCLRVVAGPKSPVKRVFSDTGW